MNKEQAIQALANHLNLLTDYDVLEANLAETLHMYITEIIEQIDESSNEEAINNIVEIWSTIKDSKSEDDYGSDFEKE